MARCQKITAYYHGYSIFKTPPGINLEDKTVVKDWWIKWNALYIEYTNGQTVEYAPLSTDDGHKWPEDTYIESSDEEEN
jgi:hypothetical protein